MRTGFKKAGLAVAMAAATVTVSTPAMAGNYRGGDYYESRYGDYYGDRRDYRRGRDYRGDRYYRGYRSQRCSSGTTGTIIGAIAGGLLGREVVGRRGDRTAGAIVGAGVGALAGRAIDKNGNRC
jgi:hypothetical protein